MDWLLPAWTYLWILNSADARDGGCGAEFRRRIRLVRSVAAGSPSTVSVVATCGGWRRHRHVALVAESARNLAFGPFTVEEKE